MFINNDEIGLQSFREDVTYVMKANQITVKLVRFNSNKGKYLQSDYLGIKTKTFEDEPELIQININSNEPSSQDDTEHGYDGSGSRMFTAYVSYDVKISNKDIIVLLNNYNYDLKAGTRFKVNLKDEGLYQGQFTFKEFELLMIDSNNELNKKEDNFN